MIYILKHQYKKNQLLKRLVLLALFDVSSLGFVLFSWLPLLLIIYFLPIWPITYFYGLVFPINLLSMDLDIYLFYIWFI